MRIVVTDTLYPQILADHYAAQPALREASYDEQLGALLDGTYGTSDAYTHHLEELGHETTNLIVNCEPLQLAWARERRFRPLRRVRLGARLPARAGAPARHRFLSAIQMAQIEAFHPDVVFVQDMSSINSEMLGRLRAAGSFTATQIASPLPPRSVYAGFDLVLSSFHHFVERLRSEGIASEYFPLGYYGRVAERLARRGISTDPVSDRPVEVSFVGGINPHVHSAGTLFLERVAGRLPLEVWGYGTEQLAPESPLLQRYRGRVWGLDMYTALATSRITINRHIDVAEGQANNMRLYEATGMGTVVLTEAAYNLDELFEPEMEVVAYRDEDDLVDKVERLLRDDEERLRIGSAGQRRTLSDHTYRLRMEELSGLLEDRVTATPAVRRSA